MPRPTSKSQLLEQTRQEYAALQQELAKLSAEEMVAGGIVGEWAVKDVLAHLMEWQQMVLSWYRAGVAGQTPITPHEDYTWREIPALNAHIYQTYRDRPLEEMQQGLATSHAETLAEIEGMDNDELFTPKVYAWTKSTTLGSYLTSATSSHYAWARKEIRRGMKAYRQQPAG